MFNYVTSALAFPLHIMELLTNNIKDMRNRRKCENLGC